MAIICGACGASMPDISSFCPVCGKVVARREREYEASTTADSPCATDLQHHSGRSKIFAGLAYLTFIPAILFLLIEPFKRDRFVRFHAFQSLLFTGAVIATAILLRLISLVLVLLPGFGLLFMLLIFTIVAIGLGLLWLVLLVKAFQGETFRLGVIGQFAERFA